MQPLAVVGNVNVDLIMGPVAPWPNAGVEVIVDHDELRIGGSAANSAFVWAALGAEFQIAANSGSDLYGQWLRDGLAPHSHAWCASQGASTISVGITHPDGERTFFTNKGHLGELTWPEVRGMLDWPRLAGGWLLVCGSFLTDALSKDYDALFDEAQRYGVRVALDTGWPPAGWTDDARARALHWAARSDCLLVNEVEAVSLARCDNRDKALADLSALLRRGGIVVVKCGSDGAMAMRGAAEAIRATAPKVEVADTIGAGDIFNAAFLFALASGDCLGDAVLLGVNTASLAVSTKPRRYARG